MKPKEIAQKFGPDANPNTISQWLRRGSKVGLFDRLPDGHWKRNDDPNWDKIAERLGTDGLADAQRKRHAIDRKRDSERYKKWRARPLPEPQQVIQLYLPR